MSFVRLCIAVCSHTDDSLVLLFGLSFSYTLPLTLSSSALQEVTPDRMRGFASAIYFVSSALIGMTVGPALVSMITDKMLGDPQKLGWSIGMVVAVAGASSMLCSFMALGAIGRSSCRARVCPCV